MVIYLYRWQLKEDSIKEFETAWATVTLALREQAGSLGSRLHRGDDAFYYGYAQWPSRSHRENARLIGPEIERARQTMREAIVQELPVIILDPIKDFLLPS